jgi:5'(3')-deoxyribonucleotidase
VKPLVIACDVDDVCAAQLKEWFRRYGILSGDTQLTHETIRGWDLSTQVLPSWSARIYDILKHTDLYDKITPLDGALAGVQLLRDAGHRVVFVSACAVDSMGPKVRWLQRHGFLPSGYAIPDFIAATSKYLIRADVLIDDHVKNVTEFPGRTILIRQPHNCEISWNGMEADSLLDAAHLILSTKMEPV